LKNKEEIFNIFGRHVSSGKVEFYRTIGFSLVIGKREGPWIYDIETGDRYLDCHCNGGVYNLGHSNPIIKQALVEALNHRIDIGNHHLVSKYRAELAEKLAEVTPEEITRVTYGVGGGEVVDFAIKLARGYTGRHKIIYARGGYHGHTGLALAAGDERYKKPFEPLAPGFIEVPFGDINALAEAMDNETAAVIFETIPATMGMPLPPDDYYRGVRELCEEKGALLILDEIQTGLGRTGKLWAFQHYDVVPDIFVVGKGLSGGLYPITAALYKEELDTFLRNHPFIHVSTFGGAELGCIVASKVIDIVSNPDFLRHVNAVSKKLREILESIKKEYGDILIEIRQKGLFIGLKMSEEGYGPLLSIAAYNNGILAVYSNNDTSVLQFLPPLIIGEGELEYIKQHLGRAYAWASQNRDLLQLVKTFLRT